MMLILLNGDTYTAVFISCFSVRKPSVTAIAAACCAAFIFNGILTLYVGLIVIRK